MKEVTVRDLEDALERALPGEGIFDQIESIRESLKRVGTSVSSPDPHFLVEALTKGWWAKFLPSTYGLLIGLEKTQGRPLYYFLMIRRGSIAAFFSPDLSSLSVERASETAEVVKYLAEKYSVRVQGVVTHYEDWMLWAQSQSPWKKVASALRQDRLQFVPFRFRLAALVGSRGHLGL